ncbi:thioesterase family protein [soil metagenome]
MTSVTRRAADRPKAETRAAYAVFITLATRWGDNDLYGHVNNAIYYTWFDTVINQYLIEAGALDLVDGKVVGLVVDTQCSYFAPVSYPDRVNIGLKVSKAGTTSVRYSVGVFREREPTAAAQGHFVHVYVDRQTRRPVALPEALRRVIDKLSL